MDRIGANFDQGVQTMIDRLARAPRPHPAADRRGGRTSAGIIDLVEMQAITYQR